MFKNTPYSNVLLLTLLISGCSNLPSTSCSCLDELVQTENAVDSKYEELDFYGTKRRENYASNYPFIKQQKEKFGALVVHCKSIFEANGNCSREHNSRANHVDIVYYTLRRKSYTTQFSGDFQKDSIYHARAIEFERLADSAENAGGVYFPPMQTDVDSNQDYNNWNDGKM